MEFTLGDKVVRYADGGRAHDPGLPGVVMVHGAGMNRTVWQMQTRYLAHHGYRVAAVDLPGHGGSDGPPLESIPAMGDWVGRVIDALEMGPAHVVGHSMGTFVAIEAAAQRPDLVASIVLIGTAASMPVHPELLDSAANDVPHASRLMSSWSFGHRAHVGRHSTPGMWQIGGSQALFDTSRPDSLGVDMAACNAYDSSLSAAAEVSCPVTYVLGARDKMTPTKRAADLIAVTTQAEVVTIDCGHMLTIEAPDETRDAIVAALDHVEAEFP